MVKFGFMLKLKTKWTPCDVTTTVQLTASMYCSSRVNSIPLETLPSGLDKMNGIESAFARGLRNCIPVSQTLSAIGELVLTRTDGLTGKGYNYVIGLSANGVIVCSGQFKKFECHHWNISDATPFSGLFGHGIAAVCNYNLPDK